MLASVRTVLLPSFLLVGASAFSTTTTQSNIVSQLRHQEPSTTCLSATVPNPNDRYEYQDVGAQVNLPNLVPDYMQGERANQRELVPVSLDPILCASSEPLLSPAECKTLKNWCLDQLLADKGAGISIQDYHLEQSASSAGTQILRKLQHKLSDLLALEADDEHRLTLPRYLYYPSGDKDAPFYPDAQSIVPDGLHVDSNNGKFFRHWTVLVYLNTCETSGATTFPLATPLQQSSQHGGNNNHHLNGIQLANTQNLPNTRHRDLVSYLVNNEDVHHTREWYTKNKTDLKDICCEVEQTAVDLYTKSPNIGTGARILPRQGHITLFSTLQQDGYTNPNSIHAGEAMARFESKDVLTFFYEVPARYVHDRKSLGDQVAIREQRFRQKHRL